MMKSLLNKIKIAGYIVTVVIALAVIVVMKFGLGKNDDQDWQLKQSVNGNVTIINEPGWYLKAFATVTTYPRSVQRYFSLSKKEGGSKDESIQVTFNDGGRAFISTMVRFQTPINDTTRRKAHRDFGGSVDNMIESIRSHLINCCKSSAPLMSASEHQSARKAEFTQLVHDQLAHGLYKMKKVEKILKDRTDEKGNAITVNATEIVTDENGIPIISQKSPLDEYGITILQFSITGTAYDDMTLKQFEAKKASFLAAEKSKAEREQEVQQRLMIIEKGLREKAEVEAIANKEKATATIAAQQEKEVAELKAAKFVAVAVQEKLQADQVKLKKEVEAAQKLEVAKLDKLAADQQAAQILVLADAEEQRIIKAGALTEREKGLAEIAAKRDALVAAELSKIQVPRALFTGGGQGGGDLMQNLINLKLMEGAGILDDGNTSIKKALAQVEK